MRLFSHSLQPLLSHLAQVHRRLCISCQLVFESQLLLEEKSFSRSVIRKVDLGFGCPWAISAGPLHGNGNVSCLVVCDPLRHLLSCGFPWQLMFLRGVCRWVRGRISYNYLMLSRVVWLVHEMRGWPIAPIIAWLVYVHALILLLGIYGTIAIGCAKGSLVLSQRNTLLCRCFIVSHVLEAWLMHFTRLGCTFTRPKVSRCPA